MEISFELFSKLLVNSYNGDYSDIVKVISSYIKECFNPRIEIQRFNEKKMNLIAFWGKPTFLINAHLDTVPPTGKWLTNPTELVKKGNKLFGLGTADTKGNIFALLSAAKKVKPKNIVFLFSFDEESGGKESGVTHFLDSEFSKGIKKALILEPTELKIVNKHPGYYSFYLISKSNSAHSSLKNRENSIVKMAKLIPNLEKYNITKIESGKRGNILPNECKMLISTRNYFTAENNLKTLQKKIPLDFGLIQKTSLPPLLPQKKLLGEVSFWSEAALFAQKKIESYLFGAGSIKQAHLTDEFIHIKQIEKAIKFFKILIVKKEHHFEKI